MLVVRDHPDWTDKQIAEKVGIAPAQLNKHRCPEYQTAAALARGQRSDCRKGHLVRNSDTGQTDVEACAE